MQYIDDTQRLGKANKWLLPTRPTTGHAKQKPVTLRLHLIGLADAISRDRLEGMKACWC